MKNKLKILCFVLVILAPFLTEASAGDCRCGTKIIQIGISAGEVYARCGEPSWVDSRVEYRTSAVSAWGSRTRQLRRRSQSSGLEQTFANEREVQIEEWHYNRGSNHFMQTLTFENGRLVRIETGEYGF